MRFKSYVVVYADVNGYERDYTVEASSPADASDAFYAELGEEGCTEIRIYEDY